MTIIKPLIGPIIESYPYAPDKTFNDAYTNVKIIPNNV